jgi:hypothetical protein
MTATEALARLRARVPGRLSATAWSRLLELTARFGYGARGFVYLSVGFVALLAAWDRARAPVGSRGLFRSIAEQPLGQVWLVTLAVGLFSFVLWRVLQSILDADRQGRSLKALGKRAGQAASGIFYGVLGFSVLELVDEIGERGDPREAAEMQQQAQSLLALPFGGWLLLAIGLVVLAAGIGNIIQGFRGDFASALKCDRDLCRRVVPLARTGYVARGFAYLPLGGFIVLAGLHARASEVQSLSGALQALERQPFGTMVLSLTASGLMAFGAFAFVEARYRRIRAPRDIAV